jgi:hypothetical protein
MSPPAIRGSGTRPCSGMDVTIGRLKTRFSTSPFHACSQGQVHFRLVSERAWRSPLRHAQQARGSYSGSCLTTWLNSAPKGPATRGPSIAAIGISWLPGEIVRL